MCWLTNFSHCRLVKKKRVDQSETLTLPFIRHSLIRQEDSIIFSLLERAQYCYNADTYDHYTFSVDSFNGSLVELMVRETEKLHAQVISFLKGKLVFKKKRKYDVRNFLIHFSLKTRWADIRTQMSYLSSQQTYLSRCFHLCNIHRYETPLL